VIAVVGGTGRLGKEVVARLVRNGMPVRVVARHARPGTPDTDPGTPDTDPGTPATDPALAGAELMAADVGDARQARAAVSGASHVVATLTGMDPRRGAGPKAVDRDAAIALIDAAVEAGCHLVLVSVVGAAADSPIELFRMKAEAEQHLRRSGMPWTIVRATAFAELWTNVIRASAGRDGRARLLGPARSPMNFVHVTDVAGAVVRATEDDALIGRCIEVGGTENLSLTDFAAQLTGRPPRHLPHPLVRAIGRVAEPLAPGLARIARQATAMETVDLSFDPGPARQTYPWLTTSAPSPGSAGTLR
jgi:uncharacterized protein YbjT (DUF2867 family)